LTRSKQALTRIIGSALMIAFMSLFIFSFTKTFTVKPDPAISTFALTDYPPRKLSSDDKKLLSIPFIKGNFLLYSGRIDVSMSTHDGDLVVFVPSYTGYLSLQSGDRLLYESKSSGSEFAPNRLQTAFLELEKPYTNHIIYNLIIPDGFIGSPSVLYTGPKEFLEPNHLRYELYKTDLRFFNWSVEVFVICFMGLLFLLRSLDKTYIPYFEAFVFLALFQSPIVLSGFFNLFNLYPYIAVLSLPLTPILFEIHGKITQTSIKLHLQKIKIIMYLIACFLIALELLIPMLNLRKINLFITFPSLLLAIIVLAVWSYYDFIKCNNFKSFVFSLLMTFVAFSIGHDLAVRVGALQSPILMSTLSTFCFLSTLSIIVSSEILKSRTALENHAIISERKLSEMQTELQKSFERTIKLKTENAIQVESTRITRDLHDGVLTYLSMIKTLAEEQSDETLRNIEKLSTNALLEIRAIIENDCSDASNILNMISTLRSQIRIHKEKEDISIHWDILKLADQNIISQTHSLNILRIIQEAINNAMHRAHSKKIIIAVDCLEDENTVVFVVKNTNGRPFSQRKETGQGIQNMKRRAKLIGAEFELTGLTDGAVMQLTYKRDILPQT